MVQTKISEAKMSAEDKKFQQKMENTINVEIDLTKLPKDKADKIKAMKKEEEKQNEAEWKKENKSREARHAKRTDTILKLLTGEELSSKEEVTPSEEK